MSRGVQPPEKEYVSFTLRVPKDLVEAFDRAIELGYFDAKSRNEAIVKVMREALNDIFFVTQAVKKAQEKANSSKYKNSRMPKEFLYMQLAFELLADTPESESVEEKYSSLIAITGSRLKSNKEEFEQFATLLEKLFSSEEVQE